MTTMRSTTRIATRVAIAKDHVATVNGLRLHYRVVGERDAPPVLMLHGIMGHCREWDALVQPLSADHRMIVVDQRGHGESDRAAEYTPEALADDVIALIEELDLAGASVIGHSMGGMAALVAAARRPDLVERLAVIDVGPDAVSGEFAAELVAFLRALGAATYVSVEEAVAAWEPNPLADRELLRHYVEHCLVRGPDGLLRWRFDSRGLTRFFSAVTEAELWDAVDRIRCPVLVVRGEDSPVLSAATTERMVARLADAGVAVIANGGHDLGVEQPAAVAAAVGRFLVPTPVSGGPEVRTRRTPPAE